MTAVEWLEEQTRKSEWHSLKRQDILEKAKEMEKQQIIDAYVAGDVNGVESMIDHGFVWLEPEEYYNETFKK